MRHAHGVGRQIGQVVVGTLLVAVGILFLGQQLHLWQGWSFRRLWPIVPMLLGLSHLVDLRRPDARVSGVLLVGSAVVLLLHTMQVVALQSTWPLFVVIGGIAMMWRGLLRDPTDSSPKSDSYGH